MDFIKEMPKIDLHNHLDGGMRPRTVIEIALDEGISIPSYDEKELVNYLTVGDNCESLLEYLEKFDLPLKCLQSAKSQIRAAEEAVEDAARENVKYLEIRFALQLMREKGLSCEEVIGNVIDGLHAGTAKTGVKAAAIACCMRHQSENMNIQVIEAAAGFAGRGLCGVDLAGDEKNYPPYLFRRVFSKARAEGLRVTVHAGEAGGPENIGEAVENLGAERIGHGIRLRENRTVYDMVLKKRIPLEICVTSNIQTKAAADFSSHPIKEYFDAGLIVTANTDNTTVSGTNMTRELKILAEKFGFSCNDLKTLQFNAAGAAFLEDGEKNNLISDLKTEFKNLEYDYYNKGK